MQHLSRSTRVKASADDAFQLVNKIEDYKNFLPFCTDSRVLASGKDWLRAELAVQLGPTDVKLRTYNSWQAPNNLHLKQISGPFSEFYGHWQFTDLEEGFCQARLKLSFSLKPPLRWLVKRQVLERLANDIMAVFYERIQQ